MTPLQFLAEVLPSPGNGYYCAAELTTKKKQHVYGETLDEIAPKIADWSKRGYDTYFALGTFSTGDNRTKDNMCASQVLAVDLDCNHPKDIPDADGNIKPKSYASAKAAAHALKQFCDDTGLSGLGDPWLVHSGGGIHAYWPLDRVLEKDEWYPLARRFKELCNEKGLRIDNAVTGDASRVLRVFDSTNTGVKSGKAVREKTTVRFIADGDRFKVEDIDALLTAKGFSGEAKLPMSSSLVLAGQRPTSVNSLSPTAQALAGNSVTRFKTILLRTKSNNGCGQLAYYINNASDDGMEPLWRGLLSWTKCCIDGEKAGLWLSDMHPYAHDRMYQKLHEIKGPYSCEAMNDANPGVCGNCKFRGKITNPLIWGREVTAVTEESVVETDAAPNPDTVEFKVMRPAPPRGYAYGKQGGVFLERDEVDDQGNVTKRHIMLLPYDLFPIDILNKGGIHEVHFVAVRNRQTFEIVMPQKCIASKDDTIKHLASQNIVAAFSSSSDKNFFEYVRASVEKLSLERNPIMVPESYGWADDDSFVFASRIYKKNEKPLYVPMGLDNIVANTVPTGSLDKWREIVNMMIRRKLWKQLTIMLAGAGAPLMRFTGLFGVTLHAASSESGTGKSLALDAAASIWGHPVHYRTGAGTSPVAMQQRLGHLRSLPLITDEITSKNRQDFEWFPAFIFSMSEGRGKERMESGTNKERVNLSTWASFAIMSSNRPAIDYLAGARLHSSEGEMRRLIELQIDEKLSWEPEEIELIKNLQENYAVAGEILAQYLVDNVDYVRELVKRTVQQMYKEYNAPNDERFWMAGAGTIIAAGVLFNSQHGGLVDIPMKEIIECLRDVFNNQRKSLLGSKRTAEDVLNSYIQEYQGKLVVVKYGDSAGLAASFSDGSIVSKNTTRTEVMGRVEHGVTAGCVDFYIEERLLRAYCSNMSFSYATFKGQLERLFNVSYVQRKDLMAKTDGPHMRVAAMRISRRITETDDAVIVHAPVPVAVGG
jgi:hypothetical protein